ncbi:hypothetical protein LCGC14_2373430 [marine sediment metagenome]|uniref:Uncharacterized protein n=1 Tax=marine sediment metagenome TaxID=412755 RepID=A0A0F9EXN8_9ZZZZ
MSKHLERMTTSDFIEATREKWPILPMMTCDFAGWFEQLLNRLERYAKERAALLILIEDHFDAFAGAWLQMGDDDLKPAERALRAEFRRQCEENQIDTVIERENMPELDRPPLDEDVTCDLCEGNGWIPTITAKGERQMVSCPVCLHQEMSHRIKEAGTHNEKN